jgi:hypothetical protein
MTSIISLVQSNSIKITFDITDFIIQENYNMLYSENTSAFIISEFFSLYQSLEKVNNSVSKYCMCKIYKDFKSWLEYVNENPIMNF